MKVSAVVLVLVAFQAAAAVLVQATAPGTPTVGYYNDKCNVSVEGIVRDIVKAALDADITNGAALVRLFFHDCFVRGCDGSVLLDPTYANPYPEKTSGANIGLRGFDVIDAIKANIETACPNTVSCADILAFAARDASRYLSNGGINYIVPAGRPDGVVSLATDAENNLPGSTFEVSKLISNFAAKGFTLEELVILCGAHSIGRAHCSSFNDRLSAPSSEINPYFRDNVLAKYCGAGPADPTVENNIRDQNATALGNLTSYVVPASGGASLDNSYYINNLKNLVLFHSDWALVGTNSTLRHVHEYADNGTLWNLDFADALVKLSKLSMPPGSSGEIRKTCRATNY
ncbi:Peroxidase 2 [Dichanthelium oligosanthes]|uniref:Peroxidase n=1 Tax=Dichanthelium oligosanthes TaxID=888268 RepID=A0A1E5UR88_9POAL|nr:Peroxidase 2 [Dichanthelium oligosanthes]